MTAPNLATETAALWAALNDAAETITALANCIGREDYGAEKRAMERVDLWNKRIAHLRGDHRRAMVVRALEEAA